MSLATVLTRAQIGIQSPAVVVETHLSAGLPGFNVVGLPEASVRESKDRVRSAIINSGFEFPMRRITINLAPADLPKEGGRYDLPIALSILKASGQLDVDLTGYEFIGELALSGALRAVRGALPSAISARDAARLLVLPQDNHAEVACLSDAETALSQSLIETVSALKGLSQFSQVSVVKQPSSHSSKPMIDLAEVKDQFLAKRGLEIAATGGHNLLFCGPPGSGKTMLAKAFTGILPELNEAEMIENACIFSVQSKAEFSFSNQRPYRQPHHSSSAVALIGGGAKPQPGEISLAHNGVLFLDELPEFERRVLDMLREPMEAGEVHISRAAYQVTFPASFQLIAAMNPCPCGYLGDPEKSCGYTCNKAKNYQGRISGPLLDRIDLHIQVQPVKKLFTSPSSTVETSERVRQRVVKTRSIQLNRQGCLNSQLSGKQLDKFCPLTAELNQLLEHSMEQYGFSARVAHKLLKVSRTLADMQDSPTIEQPHLFEALGFRSQMG